MSLCDCSCVSVLQAEGEDSLKKVQLMELAILNGTYRDANIKSRKDDITAPLSIGRGRGALTNTVEQPFVCPGAV